MEGFEGDFCEVNLDDCVDVNCQNGGKCVDQNNDFICDCPFGYIGQ